MSVETVSNCLLVGAYFLLWPGMTSSTWRTERGYVFTLWQRCDRHGCIHEVTGLNSYLAIVRGGALFALLCLSISVVAIFVKRCTFSCRKLWQTRAVNVLAIMAAFALAPCLGLYGMKTVMKGKQQSYPALGLGFTLCALAVMLTLGASILRVMGPVRTWEDGLSFLLPKDGLLLENRMKYFKHKRRQHRRHHHHHTPGFTVPLFSMFYDKGKGHSYYAYASVASSRSDFLQRHSYEEIDINEMPAPPPELLDPPPPPPPPPTQQPPCPAPRTRDIQLRTMNETSRASPRSPRRPQKPRKQAQTLRKEQRALINGDPSRTVEVRYHTMPSNFH